MPKRYPKRYKDRKECTHCFLVKSYDDFGISVREPDGQNYFCKDCINIISRKFYQENKVKILKRHSKYVKDGRKKLKPDPLKVNARVAFRYAVKQGKIIKQSCEVCSEPNAQGHHEDYRKPFDVRWLCVPHHALRHRLGSMGKLYASLSNTPK